MYRVLKLLIKFSINTEWLRYFLDSQTLSALEQKQVAYIVSAGKHSTCQSTAQTTFAQRSACKKSGRKFITGIRADLFDVVFTIHEQQAVLPHYFYYPIAPNKMSALPLTRERARNIWVFKMLSKRLQF